jgi:hypothetical protein
MLVGKRPMRKVMSRSLPMYVKVRHVCEVSRRETDEKSGFSDSAGDRRRCRMCVRLDGERPMKRVASRTLPVTVESAVCV